jgi:hypothetical protein
MIKTASQHYANFDRPAAERVHVAQALRQGHPVVLPQVEDVYKAPSNRWATLVAWVDHGRWVVGCPSCNSAQIADPDDPRFFCYVCKNTDNGQRWIAVHFPKPDVRREIESVLDDRPKDETRNWLPHETVGDLVSENESKGIRIREFTKVQLKHGSGLPGLKAPLPKAMSVAPIKITGAKKPSVRKKPTAKKKDK